MTAPCRASGARGFTLIEAMIGLVVLAIVAVAALPSFGAMTDRARLRAAAETLAADLQEARFEAARGGALVLEFGGIGRPDGPWCWSVARQSGCGCGDAGGCRLKASETSTRHAGIALEDAEGARFEADGAASGGRALLRSPRGESLRVDLGPLGRARVCSPGASVPGYASC